MHPHSSFPTGLARRLDAAWRRVSDTLAPVVTAGADLVLPVTCGGCGRPGERWCVGCGLSVHDDPIEITPRVEIGVPSWALSRYRGPVRRAVIAAKDRGRRDLTEPLGIALADGLRTLARWGELPDSPRLHLIPAPTRTLAARRRGGDTVTAVSRHAAAHLGARVDVTPILVTSTWVRDSSGLSARHRAANLRGTIGLRRGTRGCTRCVCVLVDDVLTTGATAAESVRVLRAHGVDVAAVVVIAHV